MKKSLLIAALLCTTQPAYAGFAVIDSAAQAQNMQPAAGENAVLPSRLQSQPSSQMPSSQMNVSRITRSNARPSLEIINERFIPADIEKKYAAENNPVPVPAVPLIAEEGLMTTPEAAPAPEKTAIRTMVVTSPDAPKAPEAMEIAAAPVPLAAMPASTTGKALIVEDKIKKPVIPVPPERYETWRARKGEFLRDVLKRWSERSQTEFMWSAAESPKIADDFSFIGPFEQAASKLMEKNPSQLNMKFEGDTASVPLQTAVEPMAGNPTVTPSVSLEANALPPAEETVIQTASVNEDFAPMTSPSYNPMVITNDAADDMSAMVPTGNDAKSSETKSFYAAKGSSLKDVLESWAETENARLIWQTGDNFTVNKSINAKDGYESALSQMLESFDKQSVRPVGQLYKNPVTNEKVLVIRTDKAG